MTAVEKTPPPYDTIIFDCDSTLSRIEGIELLATEFSDEVSALTERAMNGELPLEAVYGKRLETIQPTRAQVEEIGQRYIETLFPNVGALVSALLHAGKTVRILSGGLLTPVRILAESLGLAADAADAVPIRFDESGAYAGFDESSLLARAGGKPEHVRALQASGAAPGRVALVGDGVTDLEAAPLCARFVAFGGAAQRERVFAAADATCATPDFAALVPLLLAPAEIEALTSHTDHAALMGAARSLSAH